MVLRLILEALRRGKTIKEEMGLYMERFCSYLATSILSYFKVSDQNVRGNNTLVNRL